MAVPSKQESRRSSEDEELSASEVAQAALDQVSNLTGKRTASATAIKPTDEGWEVEVEVVEECRIPSTLDILALYETQLDTVGELISYRRTRRFVRGQSDQGDRLYR